MVARAVHSDSSWPEVYGAEVSVARDGVAVTEPAAVVGSAELWVVCKEGRAPTRAGGWRAPPSAHVGSWAGGPGLCHTVEVTGTRAGTAGRFWLTPELGHLEWTRSPLRGRGQAQEQAADTLWAWQGEHPLGLAGGLCWPEGGSIFHYFGISLFFSWSPALKLLA